MSLPGNGGMTSEVLPIHVGVHYLGCAAQTSDGVAMRGAVGPHIECLADSVEQVTVVAYDPPPNPAGYEDMLEFVARPARDNITVCSLGPKGTWRNYLQRRRHVQQVVASASKEWDVVLFRMPNRRAGLVFQANQCPRVVTMTGGYVPGVVRATRMPFLRKLLILAPSYHGEFHFRRIARGSGLLFANSEVLMNQYQPLFPEMQLQRSSARRARFSYQVGDRMLTPVVKFLYVGKLTQGKGVFELMDAFARIKQDILPAAELHLAGIGDAMDALRNAAHTYGVEDSVKFYGWVPVGKPLFDLYRQMDAFLFLSHVEGFPKVVWEAVAHSVPVVCTPVGGLPYVFEDGREVLFVPVGEVAPVVEAVRRLKEYPDLRRRLIANGYERAQEATLEAVVEDLLQHLVTRWPELALPRQRRLAGDEAIGA